MVVVYAPAEIADTLPLFLLYPYMYSVVGILTNGACRPVVHLDELNVVNLPLVVGLRVAAQYEQHLLPRKMQQQSQILFYTVKNMVSCTATVLRNFFFVSCCLHWFPVETNKYLDRYKKLCKC
jgi:hypothetical protein